MKQLFPFLVLLAGCSVHKNIQTQKKTLDSAAVSIRDTSFKSNQVARTDNLQVKDVDITVNYDTSQTPADSALAAAKSRPVDRSPMKTKAGKKLDDFAAIIEDAVANSGNAGNIASVTIHIGSIADSSRLQVTTDTGHVHATQVVQVKETAKDQVKATSKTSLPWWVWVAGGLIGLILLVILAFRIYKKFLL